MRGFVRVSAAVPKVKITDFEFNRQQIFNLWEKADKENSILVCFPELCLTAYSAKDLLGSMFLLSQVEKSAAWLLEKSKTFKTLAVLGLPIIYENSLYNCAAVLQQGEILGIVPKSYLPNYGEFEESRWFRPGRYIPSGSTLEYLGKNIPFGTDILFSASNIPNCKIGIEICEDLFVQSSPHIYQINSGATIIANPSASNFTIGKADIREFLAKSTSDKGKCCYIYTSASPGESSELAWDGHHFICENGNIIAKGARFSREPQLLSTDIDLESLVHDRLVMGTFGDCADINRKEFRTVSFEAYSQDNDQKLMRKINRHPFIPSNTSTLSQRCWEVFEIQTNSLRTRLEKIGCKYIILGLSGGLDSTLAALSASNTLDSMGLPRKNLICVTMPGFGTTEGTKNSACDLANALGTELIEASIGEICKQVLQLIGSKASEEITTLEELLSKLKEHPETADITVENVQSRVRTLLLMSYANKLNGLVLGTGDLSEKALGWCTYAGDQISMFDINSGIPKTLIQFIIKWVAAEKVNEWSSVNPEELKSILFSILETPISPELLPPGFEGQITQLTEEKIGPYELNDFFLYWHVRFGASPQKILDLAKTAFEETYNLDTIKKWLKNFYIRFATQQYKRNASADGPKIGMVDLSSRVSWRMSTDTEYKKWVAEVEKYS
ncbi:MAG: NAD(+) synthase [Deltaproteobacteria bacterium]